MSLPLGYPTGSRLLLTLSATVIWTRPVISLLTTITIADLSRSTSASPLPFGMRLLLRKIHRQQRLATPATPISQQLPRHYPKAQTPTSQHQPQTQPTGQDLPTGSRPPTPTKQTHRIGAKKPSISPLCQALLRTQPSSSTPTDRPRSTSPISLLHIPSCNTTPYSPPSSTPTSPVFPTTPLTIPRTSPTRS